MNYLAWTTLFGSSAVLAAADQIAEQIGSAEALQFGALSALIAALFFLLKVHLPAKDKMFVEALDRRDDRLERMERLRHEDSQDLNEALTSIRENCAAAQSKYLASKDLN